MSGHLCSKAPQRVGEGFCQAGDTDRLLPLPSPASFPPFHRCWSLTNILYPRVPLSIRFQQTSSTANRQWFKTQKVQKGNMVNHLPPSSEFQLGVPLPEVNQCNVARFLWIFLEII